MDGAPPTSVLLPTTNWTSACEDVADQLRATDEFLVICDDSTDSIATHVDDLSEKVRLVVAGEPTGCSGKANAIATGMKAARHDRIVWTDDDFHHPSDWLTSLHADYDRHGPVSELPFFVGHDPLSVLLEPIYALGGTLGVYTSDKAWAGAVMFERDDLDVDAFLSDLRQTVSDDGLLSEYLEVTPLRRVRRVEIGGTIRETLERHVRFTQIVRQHDLPGIVSMGFVTLLLAMFCLLVPAYAFGGTTIFIAGVYAFFGVRRWTALLAYPAILAQVPLMTYALARRTFVWGGRRYRWESKFDVTVVD
ncbi:glycosyltransferase [Halorussus salinisoli]|uniref:glycosyltransferase n=1 Tax=Halorussus salinisoli TaxID=2558242 RepID=UPI0010C15F89|nr:glycosyltransferase family A protein [Halorussus salinisoli]